VLSVHVHTMRSGGGGASSPRADDVPRRWQRTLNPFARRALVVAVPFMFSSARVNPPRRCWKVVCLCSNLVILSSIPLRFYRIE